MERMRRAMEVFGDRQMRSLRQVSRRRWRPRLPRLPMEEERWRFTRKELTLPWFMPRAASQATVAPPCATARLTPERCGGPLMVAQLSAPDFRGEEVFAAVSASTTSGWMCCQAQPPPQPTTKYFSAGNWKKTNSRKWRAKIEKDTA